MAQQDINIGTAANSGDGDTYRAAFAKVQSNFDELYAGGLDLSALPHNITTVNGITFWHIKGSGNVLAALEIDDKIFGSENGVLIIAIYLGGTVDNLSDPAIWDKSTIG